MDDTSHDLDLANEQAANNNYRDAIQTKSSRNPEIAVPASSRWTGSALPVPQVQRPGPLVGRVGLAGKDPAVDSDNFYIGPWKYSSNDLVVFSWAAPVAAAFYGIETGDYQLDHPVAIRRIFTYDPSGAEINALFDEQVLEPLLHNPFEAKRQLNIPAPPIATGPTEIPEQDNKAQPVALPVSDQEPTSDHEAQAPRVEPITKPTPLANRSLRAESALRAALGAPRSRSLPTLLATLQPDQYDFVTRSTASPLVIQGHPGTGKTVIAAHRAAYMVHPDNNPTGLPPKILMVGPTTNYAQHVTGILDSLIPDGTRTRVTVLSISQVLGLMRRQSIRVAGPLDGEFFEVSIELGAFTEAAAHELRISGSLEELNLLQAGELVYETIRTNRLGGLLITDDPEWMHNLRSLPPWKSAVGQRRLHPLITQCIWSVSPDMNFQFDHIIVDEAQDIRPLEWILLSHLMIEPSWTILGDMNQRRSDASYASWSHITRDIGLTSETEDFEPEQFQLGYRSTQQIMDFANVLLPRNERLTLCIQNEGVKPAVLKTSEHKITESALDAAQELATRYSKGTAAVITTSPQEFVKALRKRSWIQDKNDQHRFSNDSTVLSLLTPELARGLEFDAVVVVEPQSFPQNLGRHGALYTSLTRANKELVVIHSQGLPDALRKAAR